MPSFFEISPSVPEQKILKGFCHIWTGRPSWSCDLVYLNLAIIGQAVSEKKISEIVDGRTTDDERTDA